MVYICYNFECISCDDSIPTEASTYCDSDAPTTYPDAATCESSSNGGLGCDPVVCMKVDQKCYNCSDVSEGRGPGGEIFGTSTPMEECGTFENTVSTVPGYATKELCGADRADGACGELIVGQPPPPPPDSDPYACVVETGQCYLCSELPELFPECTVFRAMLDPETPCECPDTCIPEEPPPPAFCAEECPTEVCGEPTCTTGTCATYATDCSSCSPIAAVSTCTEAEDAACVAASTVCAPCAECTGGPACEECYFCEKECPTEVCGEPTCTTGACATYATDCSSCSPIAADSTCTEAEDAACVAASEVCAPCAECTGGTLCETCYDCYYDDKVTCEKTCGVPL